MTGLSQDKRTRVAPRRTNQSDLIRAFRRLLWRAALLWLIRPCVAALSSTGTTFLYASSAACLSAEAIAATVALTWVRIIERRLAFRRRRCSAWFARLRAEAEFAKVDLSESGLKNEARIIFTAPAAVNLKMTAIQRLRC